MPIVTLEMIESLDTMEKKRLILCDRRREIVQTGVPMDSIKADDLTTPCNRQKSSKTQECKKICGSEKRLQVI